MAQLKNFFATTGKGVNCKIFKKALYEGGESSG